MKRFRLDITGKLEDRPRLLRAYGKIPGGEVALVLRPTAYGGVLVHVTKTGATQWSASDEVPAGWTRVRAQIVRGQAELRDGPSAGRVVPLTGAHPDGYATVAVAPGLDRATVVPLGDAPLVPDAPLDPADAVRAVKRAQTGLDKPGPTTLRGQWAGSLVWDEGPYVELRRKLASYGSVVVSSGADGWRWAFEREERWFTPAGHEADGPFATLVQAIDAGMLGALGLVQAACGVRDTRRRQGLDTDWATSHPLPEPRETSDPTERLREPRQRSDRPAESLDLPPSERRTPRSPKAPSNGETSDNAKPRRGRKASSAKAPDAKPRRGKASGRTSSRTSQRRTATDPSTATATESPCGCAVPDVAAPTSRASTRASTRAPQAPKPPRPSRSPAATSPSKPRPEKPTKSPSPHPEKPRKSPAATSPSKPRERPSARPAAPATAPNDGEPDLIAAFSAAVAAALTD